MKTTLAYIQCRNYSNEDEKTIYYISGWMGGLIFDGDIPTLIVFVQFSIWLQKQLS